MFFKNTVEQEAKKMIDKYERQLLEQKSLAIYHIKMVEFYSEIIMKLKEESNV